jgi:GNAT superfamily N-acetyltransferase
VTQHRLRDGTDTTVRQITASDADGLVRFHESLSRESQRSRFFAVHPHLSVVQVERFTIVDHCDRQAFVAVVDGEIVAVGRYDRVGDTDAEVAFVTRDDHQGLGIATLLFQELAGAATAVGITRFLADTLPENHKMLDLFTRTGLVVDRRFGRGEVEVTIQLQP